MIRVAYHEAGHVVIARVLGARVLEARLGRNLKLRGRPADLDGRVAGRTILLTTNGNAASYAMICLAGITAESILLRERTPRLVDWLRRGWTDQLAASAYIEQAGLTKHQAHRKTFALVRRLRPQIARGADTLARQWRLSGRQIDRILSAGI